MQKLTNRAKILNLLQSQGFITKHDAARKHWSFGLGQHISQLRKHHNIETVMRTNLVTGSAFAVYTYLGKKK